MLTPPPLLKSGWISAAATPSAFDDGMRMLLDIIQEHA